MTPAREKHPRSKYVLVERDRYAKMRMAEKRITELEKEVAKLNEKLDLWRESDWA